MVSHIGLSTLLLIFVMSMQWNITFSIRTNETKLIAKLKKLGGGESPLPDFLFFTLSEMRSFSLNHKSVFPRTIKDHFVPPGFVPRRSRAEFTLAKAINQLRNDKNVWRITLIALLLEKVIAERPKKPRRPKIVLPWWKGPERIYITNVIKMFTGDQDSALKSDVRTLMKEADGENQDGGGVAPIGKNKKHNNIYKKKSSIERRAPMWMPQHQSNGNVFDNWYQNKEENFDFKRMRRALPYSNTGGSICREEGSGIDEPPSPYSKQVRMCGLCLKTVDFGGHVVPRFANSVECTGAQPSCLLGDGECIQKVVYYRFHRFISINQDGSENWRSHQQPLNTSCECQCHVGSIIQSFFIPDPDGLNF